MADGLHYHDDSEGDSMEEESTELKQAAEEAFPDEDWTPERLGSLKTLMKMCMGEYGPDGADDDMFRVDLDEGARERPDSVGQVGGDVADEQSPDRGV